jgi:exodeoxyribonuclease X
MADWTRLRYAVVDVEGNGQRPPELVELAVVHVIAGAVGEPQNWLVKPPTKITYMAVRVHGIHNADVADAPPFAEVAPQVRDALAVDAIVAHNAHVDIGVLAANLDGWRPPLVFDTLKLARRLLPGQPSYRLGSLVAALRLADGQPPDLVPHRATYDVLVTARLFVLLAAEAGTLEALQGQDAPSLF